MNRLKITTSRFWYKVGETYPILGFDKAMGYEVDRNLDEGAAFYVRTSDCEVGGEQAKEALPILRDIVEKPKELLIKLIPNSEGKCVDFPVKLEQGDWIDLRACTNYEFGITYYKGDSFVISFGLAVKLPVGYEAYILPRSSLFKKYGIMLVNSQGIIDNSYKGENDIWMGTFIAFEDGKVPFNERICQFRIQKNQPTLKLTQVDNLEGVNRGGFGEGTKHEK